MPGVIARSRSTTGSSGVDVDDDQGGCVRRRFRCLGDHERDGLTRPQDLGPGQRLVETVAALRRDRQVCGGQYGHDAGHRQRLVRLDPLDPRVGGKGEHRPAVEEPTDLVIGGESRSPGDLDLAIDPRDRPAERGAQPHARTPRPVRWGFGTHSILGEDACYPEPADDRADVSP